MSRVEKIVLICILVIFVYLLHTSAKACDDVEPYMSIVDETTVTLEECTVQVQKTGSKPVLCDYKEHFPQIIWDHVLETDCKMSEGQKVKLLTMDMVLDTYRHVVDNRKGE